MKKAARIAGKSRQCVDYSNALIFFEKTIVTIDITTKQCYSMLARCNNDNYIKFVKPLKQEDTIMTQIERAKN